MKNIALVALVAIVGATGFAAAPAMAAAPAANQVPYCSSNSMQFDLQNGTYAQELAKPGLSLDSLDVWNGCLKAIYTDAKGHTTTAFYDPDSLRQVGTLSSGKLG
jgi:hypothetical protein